MSYSVFTTIGKLIRTIDVVIRLLRYMRTTVNKCMGIEQITDTGKINSIEAKTITTTLMVTNTITVMNLETIIIMTRIEIVIWNSKEKNNAVKKQLNLKRRGEKNI